MNKVLFAAFESLPFIKTGGLADVVYALPKALNKEKFEVCVVLPLFKKIKDQYQEKLNYIDSININSGLIHEKGYIHEYINEGIKYYFIEHNGFFGRPEVYGYEDDAARFSFFNVAVLEMLIKLNYYPDIIHENDYHTAVLPALCKLRFNQIPEISRIKHVFTIHNLVYQGEYNRNILFDYLGFEYRYYEDGSLRFNDYCNFMKIGITFADHITTVSKSYANEIQTPEYGNSLEAVLQYRKNDLTGIVNGIDTDNFNPKDDAIYMNYSINNFEKGKAENKAALQRELGLEEDPDAMLVGMISRLTFQKGAELIASSYRKMLDKHVQIIILGTGESKYEYAFRTMENDFKGRACFYCGYNENLAHSIYAGLDLLLMPSLFEPCGISQLVAMHYGTLPLVRETGGLKDTVEPYNEYEMTGRGFSFLNYSEEDFINTFNYAYQTYTEFNERWLALIRNAMKYNVSFSKSSKEYEEIYKKVLNN